MLKNIPKALNFGGWGVHKKFLAIVLSGFLTRILFNLFFHLTYGFHAVNHVELWLYYAVAQGTNLPGGGEGDVTVWILRTISSLFSGHTFYVVAFCGAFFACLIGGLIYVFMRTRFSEQKALFAGFLYVFMVQPIALSVVSFTHSLIQLNLVLLSLIFVAWFLDEKMLWKKTFFALLWVLVFYVGLGVSKEMYIAFPLCLAFLFNHLWPKNFRFLYLSFMCSIIFFSAFSILPPVFEDLLSRFAQGRMGSADVIPISALSVWIRYNLLLMLVPAGLWIAFKRGDSMGLAFFFLGFAFAVHMDRGSRIADIGVSMLAAHALTWFRGSMPKWFIAYCSLVLVWGIWVMDFIPTVSIFFFLSFLALFFCLRHPKKFFGCLILFCAVNVLLVSLSLVNKDPSRMSVEAEYRILNRLSSEKPGLILIGWDRGFMARALTGFRSVSTPASIDYGLHDSLWLLPEQTSEILRREAVEYIVLSDRDFKLLSGGYDVSLGLLDARGSLPPLKFVYHSSIYGLINSSVDDNYFSLVHEVKDPATGVRVYVYRVSSSEDGFIKQPFELDSDIETGFYPVGFLAENIGSPKSGVFHIVYLDGALKTRKLVLTHSFGRGGTEKHVIPVYGSASNCVLHHQPVGSDWGYTGSAVFLNKGASQGYNLSVYLLDGNSSLVDVESVEVHMNSGQRYALNYSLSKNSLSEDFRVGYLNHPNIVFLANESTKPSYSGVDAHVFC